MVDIEALKKQVVSWISNNDENAKNLVDLPWKVKWDQWHLILENEKIPFAFLVGFHEEALHITVRTGIETAVMENQQRLALYRVLLILNQRVDLTKFMLFGMNEEVIARVDLATDGLSKEEFNLALNILLSSLYLMVQALHLEEEFNQQVTNRMMLMIQDLISQGKSRSDIMEFLVKNLGLNPSDAEKILNEIYKTQKMSEGTEHMYA
ncbi:MAG TPA: hypothetical protein VKU79_01075 [Thermoplasmataceae archaeon]|nr:hypothetical protein [Thermoplasmatales archaeon AK]HLH85441.1 hypothetical protein [Thermoplasmataceae archaeon]